MYVQDQPYTPSITLPHPCKIFDARRIDPLGRYPHTYADPFLIVHADRLYLFFEVVYKGRHGEIAACSTNDLNNFEYHGIILSRHFHLSFPFVFAEGPSVYIVPESKKAGSITLYRFERFPFELREVRTLLRGAFVDTHLLKYDNIWYLFTTSHDTLYIYLADDLLSGEFRPHPANPVTADKRISRSGGSVLTIGSSLYRVAQDCSKSLWTERKPD